MTAAAALIQLDDLPYHWTAGKGRVRKDEPLWAIVLYRIRADGLSEDDHAFVVEGPDLPYCVSRVIAWHTQQR